MSTALATSKDSPKRESYLTWEVFLMGGASILVCLLSWLFFEDKASIESVALTTAALAFIFNHPHFLASYVLLYGDYHKRIFKRPAYLWAAVFSPLIIGAVIFSAWLYNDKAAMGYVITAMYFFVGWHYTKQVFGCVIVTSAQRKIFYKTWERRTLLFSLYAIWLGAWVKDQVHNGAFEFYGIQHASLGIPSLVFSVGYSVALLSVAAVGLMHLRKYVVEDVLPAPPAAVAYVALIVWLLPPFLHAGFTYMIPLFHSLQYLCFVAILKKNEIQFGLRHLKDQAWRSEWIKQAGTYALWCFVLGALCFEFIPKALDRSHFAPGEGWGVQPFMASVIVFINIHHYFIDNVIWKSDNETVKRFLFNNPESLVSVSQDSDRFTA